MVKDFVCGMEVDETDDHTPFQEFGGEKFYFCCVECKLIFSRDPLTFIRQNDQVKQYAKDIVCGMETDVTNPQFKIQYHGQSYYFCSQSCLREFERNPQQYVSQWK